MLKIREVIVTEGKYDVVRLRSVVDTMIVPVGGFSVFRDKEQMALLRRLADSCGLLVLTDSDAAGFLIRDHIAAAFPPAQIKHAYIPEVPGKERRKPRPSKEGLLGVEGIDGATLEAAIRAAGATVIGEENAPPAPFLTRAGLYEAGLTGTPCAAERREKLLRSLGLPHYLSTARLVEAVNRLLTPETFAAALIAIKEETP